MCASGRANYTTVVKWSGGGCKVIGIYGRCADRNRRKASSRVQVTADASSEKSLSAKEN